MKEEEERAKAEEGKKEQGKDEKRVATNAADAPQAKRSKV